jgi:hypothetical protein
MPVNFFVSKISHLALWVYLFLYCSNQYLNKLCTNRHKTILHALLRLLKSHHTPQCYNITHTDSNNHTPLNNIVPSWLLLCTCYESMCTCFARLRPYILCVRGTLLDATPSFHPFPHIHIQYIESTYCNDCFYEEATTINFFEYLHLTKHLL